MIVTEKYTDTLVRTYSDIDHYIELDGVMYEEAVCPADSDRIFAETDTAIERDDESRKAYAYNLLTGGANAPDIEKIKKQREAIVKGIEDKEASIIPEFFPKLNNNGELISAGTRINWNGVLKRATVDLWDTDENDPDNAPSLWEDISYKDGYRIIPETITSGTAFAIDECGWWGDVLYISKIDNNVWNPEQYSAGWEVVT